MEVINLNKSPNINNLNNHYESLASLVQKKSQVSIWSPATFFEPTEPTEPEDLG
jgi:hypothetical protein